MNRTLVTVAVAAAIAALPAIASAHHPAGANTGASQTPSARTAGGQIFVDGAGEVRVSGNFLAFGDVGGMKVKVIDRAGDARVIVGGRPLLRPKPRGGNPATRRGAPPRKLTFAPSAREMFSIEGHALRVTFRGGGNVMLSITGTGKVRLDGVGTFRVNSQPTQAWPLRPITLPLRQTPRPGRG